MILNLEIKGAMLSMEEQLQNIQEALVNRIDATKEVAKAIKEALESLADQAPQLIEKVQHLVDSGGGQALKQVAKILGLG